MKRAKAKVAADDCLFPEFLRIANRDKPLPLREKRKASIASRPIEMEPEPCLPPMLRLATNEYEEAGFATDKGVVPRRWANDPGTLRVIANRLDERRVRKEESLARFKEAMAERKAMQPPKVVKLPFGASTVIKVTPGAERKPGTGAAERFTKMKAYVTKNPKAYLPEIMKETGYRIDDFKWDLERGNITTDILK